VLTPGSSNARKMVTREDDLKELAISLSAANVKARQLSLPTSASILSMALLEVSQALEAVEGDDEDVAR
jgi:hypothetical protein